MSEKMKQTLCRVEAGDPEQCQAMNYQQGIQCRFKSEPASKFCIMHGGHGSAESIRVADFNQYRFRKYQARHKEFTDSAKLRSVDEEIGVLRMVLEEIVNMCESSMDLMLYSQKISDLVRDITKCVIVSDKLATKAGMLIGRQEAMVIGNRVVDILATHITDEALLLKLADEISDAFTMKVEGSDGSTFGTSIDARN